MTPTRTDILAKVITAEVAKRFRTFGRGAGDPANPMAETFKDHTPMFAMGVDVEAVVRFVMEWWDD